MKPSIKREISLIGVPMDLGAGTPGVDLGPAAIRYAGLADRLQRIGYQVRDEGDIVVPSPGLSELGETSALLDSNLRNLGEVAAVNRELCDLVSKVLGEGRFPLVLGGDHSIAIGTIAGVLEHRRPLGVIWFDAHGDINTVGTTPSGNIHGMPVAVGLGLGHEKLISIGKSNRKLSPEDIVYIGCRDLDSSERRILRGLGITVFTMHEIDRYGMTEVIERAIKIATDGTNGIHVSFDIDSIDPVFVKGTGTRVPGGLTCRECHLALEMIALSEKLVSAEFVEINPLMDEDSQTAKTAVSLIGSLLGEWLI